MSLPSAYHQLFRGRRIPKELAPVKRNLATTVFLSQLSVFHCLLADTIPESCGIVLLNCPLSLLAGLHPGTPPRFFRCPCSNCLHSAAASDVQACGLADRANMERRALGDWGGDSTLQDSELGESALTGTDWQVKEI